MERTHSSGKKRSKKPRGPAAEPNSLLEAINELRKTFHLPEVTLNKDDDRMKQKFSSQFNGVEYQESSIVLSEFNFCDVYEDKFTTQQYISKWLNDSAKRPVLFAPGKDIMIDFFDDQNQTRYIGVLLVSFFN